MDLPGIVTPAMAVSLQHEVDDICDSGYLGLLRIGHPLSPIAFGKPFGCDLFEAFTSLPSRPDPVLKVGDYRRSHRGSTVLIGLACGDFEDYQSQDVAHLGWHDHAHEPPVSLLNQIRIVRPDHAM